VKMMTARVSNELVDWLPYVGLRKTNCYTMAERRSMTARSLHRSIDIVESVEVMVNTNQNT
jgi:hypothetical protein